MTASAVDKLTKEKIAHLLDAVGVRAQEDTSADLEATEYDWRQCRYFSLDQARQLSAFAEQVAAGGAEAMGRLFQRPCNASVMAARQDYAKHLFDVDAESTGYRIAFGVRGGDEFGVLSLDRPTAMRWTGQLLGGGDAEDAESDRPLSTLEESLLLDVAAGLVAAFDAAYPTAALTAATTLRTDVPVAWDGDEPLYNITLAIQAGDAPGGQADFVIKADRLDAVAGKETVVPAPLPKAAAEAIMLERIKDIPVRMTVRLGTATVDVADIMGLEADDILILNKKVTEPVELFMNGKPFRMGRPATADGRYAVAIL